MATEDLAARVQRLEEERAVQQIIDLHSFLSDAGPAEGFAALYAEDCISDLGEVIVPGTKTVIHGRDRLMEQVYLEPGHRAAEGRGQHFRSGPQAIQIEGDDAWAVTYAITSFLIDGEAKVIVSGFNFWTLTKKSGRWRIAKRVLRRLGDEDVIELFRPIVARALAGLG